MSNELPNSYCYLVAPGLIAGEYPGAWERNETIAKIAHFLNAGVSFFLDLTQPGELIPYAELLAAEAAVRSQTVIHRRMPIRDLSVPQTARTMSDILDTIDAARAANHTVYVHCWGGVGRTGTVIGCWLVRHGMSGDEALATIARHWEQMPADKRARRPRSPETDAQRLYVRNWHEQST